MQNSKKRKSTSTLYAFPFCCLSLFLSGSSSLPPTQNESIPAIYSNYETFMNINSYIDNNQNITMSMPSKELLNKNKQNEFQNLIINDIMDYGEEPPFFEFFMELRKDVVYEQMLYSTYNISIKTKLSILNLLSQLEFKDILLSEQSLVIMSLYSENLQLQECALNLISVWNDKNVIEQIADLQIKNIFLQDRLERIKHRFK